MSKKNVKVRAQFTLSKALDDELTRESIVKDKFKNEIVEEALNELFRPFDKETHEKNTKKQLADLRRDNMAINNKLDILLIMFEEYIRTFYRNTQELVLEDNQAKIAANARIIAGHENYMKRVLDSATNIKPNILSMLNISKIEE